MKVATKSTKLFLQLLITPLQWDQIFLHAGWNMIHNNGEITGRVVIILGQKLNLKCYFQCLWAVVVDLCAAVNPFSHVPSIHLFYRACVFTSIIFQSYFFFLSAVHLSSVARPKPIFASSWWQRGGDCQGGGPCLLGKRRYHDFHKAVAALWGQISGSCCVVWFIWVYRMFLILSLLCFYPFCPSFSCLPGNVVDIHLLELFIYFLIWPSRPLLPYGITVVLTDSLGSDWMRQEQTLLRALVCAWFHTLKACLCDSDCTFGCLCVFYSMSHQVWASSAADWGPLWTASRRASSMWWDYSHSWSLLSTLFSRWSPDTNELFPFHPYNLSF